MKLVFGSKKEAMNWAEKLIHWEIELIGRTIFVNETQDENSFLVLSCFPELKNNVR